jgi:hypothetical protein
MRAAEKDMVLKPEPVLCLSSLLMTRDAVLAGAALLAKLHVADDIAAGRLAYRGSHADPAGGNLDAPKFAPPHQLPGPRFPGFVGAFPERSFGSPI